MTNPLLGEKGAPTELKAGRELDALIAEKVMGLKYEFEGDSPIYAPNDFLPHYSTEIASAWEVIDKMWRDGEWRVTVFYGGDEARWWGAEFAYDANHLGAAYHALYDRKVEARADTAPLAICRAALLAVGGET